MRLRIFEVNPSCLFSISKKMRFEETKAISIPEKNAESNKQIKMILSATIIFLVWHVDQIFS
jgi:hypothetical protein